jgi:hypothetical protein
LAAVAGGLHLVNADEARIRHLLEQLRWLAACRRDGFSPDSKYGTIAAS